MQRRPGRVRTTVGVALGALALVAALATTSAGAAPPTPEPTPAAGIGQDPAPTQDDLRLNELQFLGSHNSYHLPPFKGLYDFAKTVAPPGLNPDELLYEHPPLAQQLDQDGVRQIELDLVADPEGGRYADPAANILTGIPPYNEAYEAWNPPELNEPGTKVMHIPDFDMRTTCVLLTECLTQVRDWSTAHPSHFPIAILIELKDDVIQGDLPVELVQPLPYTAARLDDLDAEIRTVFDDDSMFTPDDLRGDAATLNEAVTGTGWPAISALRGQVMFQLYNRGPLADRYLDGSPSLENRVMFTSSTPGQPDAAFVEVNDPTTDGAAVTAAVEAGYVVRTRADTPIDQAQSGDTAMRDAAFASGAQWVSTDYPVPGLTKLLAAYGLPFAAGYSSPLPPNDRPASADAQPRLARCNPISAPDYCFDLALTEPEPPAGPSAPAPPSDGDAPPSGDGPGLNGGVPGTPLVPAFTG